MRSQWMSVNLYQRNAAINDRQNCNARYLLRSMMMRNNTQKIADFAPIGIANMVEENHE